MILFDGVHLSSDFDLWELHKFAFDIGLKEEWFQDHEIPHYDVWGKFKKKIKINCNKKELVKKAIRRI